LHLLFFYTPVRGDVGGKCRAGINAEQGEGGKAQWLDAGAEPKGRRTGSLLPLFVEY